MVTNLNLCPDCDGLLVLRITANGSELVCAECEAMVNSWYGEDSADDDGVSLADLRRDCDNGGV